ncbi:MAG: hypothetical protein WC760_12640 [Bacteroidia bacterium]|jgi:hypothetical protein
MKSDFSKEIIDFIRELGVDESALPISLHLQLHSISKPGRVTVFRFGKGAQHALHIWEDQWLVKQEIVQARLRSLLGLSRRLHARNMHVKRIDKPIAAAFLDTYHLQGSTGAYYKIGMFAGEELIAVATFSKARIMQNKVVPYRSYEWERFATAGDLAIRGGLAKLLAFFIAEVHPAHVMTYIDKDWSTGQGFKAVGFVAETEIPPRTYWIKAGEWIRFDENRLPKGLENPLDAGYTSIQNSGSIRMVLHLNTP